MDSKEIALLAREAADDKKAEQPVIMDVSELTSLTNFFFISQGRSDRQVRAIAEGIIDKLKEVGLRPFHTEGLDSGNWVCLDYGSVIAHVFHENTRDFYALERLWGDAPRVE